MLPFVSGSYNKTWTLYLSFVVWFMLYCSLQDTLTYACKHVKTWLCVMSTSTFSNTCELENTLFNVNTNMQKQTEPEVKSAQEDPHIHHIMAWA